MGRGTVRNRLSIEAAAGIFTPFSLKLMSNAWEFLCRVVGELAGVGISVAWKRRRRHAESASACTSALCGLTSWLCHRRPGKNTGKPVYLAYRRWWNARIGPEYLLQWATGTTGTY